MKKTTTIKARRGRPPRADFGTRLIRAAHEAIAIARGEADPSTYHIHVPSDLDVRAIRLRTGLSQAQRNTLRKILSALARGGERMSGPK